MLLPRDDFWKAGQRWQEVNHSQAGFEAFTGTNVSRFSGSHHINYLVSDESYRRIQLLLSPHYKTIIKMWLIKRSSKEVNPE